MSVSAFRAEPISIWNGWSSTSSLVLSDRMEPKGRRVGMATAGRSRVDRPPLGPRAPRTCGPRSRSRSVEARGEGTAAAGPGSLLHALIAGPRCLLPDAEQRKLPRSARLHAQAAGLQEGMETGEVRGGPEEERHEARDPDHLIHGLGVALRFRREPSDEIRVEERRKELSAAVKAVEGREPGAPDRPGMGPARRGGRGRRWPRSQREDSRRRRSAASPWEGSPT